MTIQGLQSMSHFIRTLLFLISLNLLNGNIPRLMPQLSKLCGFLIFLIWIFTFRPFKINRSLTCFFSVVTILVSFPFLISEKSFLFGMSLGIFALNFLSKANFYSKELPLFLTTTIFYFIYVIIYSFSPHLWFVVQNLSLEFSSIASEILGNKMTLGPSAIGIPATISVFCYCISWFIFISDQNSINNKGIEISKKINNGYRLLIMISGIILINLSYLWLQKPMTIVAQFFNPSWNPTSLDFQAVFLILILLPIYPFTRNICLKQFNPELSKSHIKVAIPGLFFIFLSILIIKSFPTSPNLYKDVVFCDKGTNWTVPSYGKTYGQHSAGMFGILPEYLKLKGYQSKIG